MSNEYLDIERVILISQRPKQRLSTGRVKPYSKSRLERAYGLTPDIFENMLIEQNYVCAICGSVKRLCVDHNHKSGRVRGLLCRNCNSALGFARDNADTLRKMATYINKNSRKMVETN